jgi:tetratricopeptide (TPR) repeat protein
MMAGSRHRISCLLLAGSLCASSVVSGQPAAPSSGGARSPGGAPAAAPNPTHATELDATAAFERARIYYESARYVLCVDAFTRLLEHPERLQLRERGTARVYLAACLIASGRADEARAQFRQAILDDRQLEPPDPVVFPPSVVDMFVQVRSSLMELLQRQQEEELERGRREAEARLRAEQRERWRVAELERLASLETVVRRNDRWMAWVPFGLGQFQNQDNTLGWIFLSSELALSITALTATSIELGLHSKAQGGRAPLDSADLTSKVRAARQVGTVAWVSLIGVAAAGIIEANLSFRGEIEVGRRRRPLPDALRAPAKAHGATVRPDIGWGWLGVSGDF